MKRNFSFSFSNISLIENDDQFQKLEFALKTAIDYTDSEGEIEEKNREENEEKVFTFPPATDLELMEKMKDKPISFYFDKKNLPDAILRPYLPDLKRRMFDLENRVKPIENRLWLLDRPDRSLEEDRFEILCEVLDKACQGFEILDEHVDHNIPLGHRVVLEAQLLGVIERKFDQIEKILDEFHKLKNDRDGVNNEREFLRYEIRACDMEWTEIHERFLKSYLDMDW
ncbi:unnamed protein product, partial [Mesorhabditis belari]|uniref:Uncharacterized protein n=1 Tax=Mesorhabditis belari TaxID=2138241 RepID=A0AAF3EMV4_9BILA